MERTEVTVDAAKSHSTTLVKLRNEQGAQAVSRETAGPLGVEGEERVRRTALPQAQPPCQRPSRRFPSGQAYRPLERGASAGAAGKDPICMEVTHDSHTAGLFPPTGRLTRWAR